MRKAIVAAVSAALLGALADPAAASDFSRRGFYVGIGGAYGNNFFEDEIEDAALLQGIGIDVKNTWGVNARLGYRLFSWFAVEAMYEYMDDFGIDLDSVAVGGLPPLPIGARVADYRTHTIGGNLKFIVPIWRIQPYLLLGIGGQYFKFDDRLTGLFSDKGWTFAGRPGAGLDLYITKNIVLNAELSGVLAVNGLDNRSGFRVGDMFYLSAGGGLQYRF